MHTKYYLAWWNVENLFDIENSVDRPEWLKRKLQKELEGWGEEQLKTKTQQLAKVIKAMNQGQGPDLLGVCEVENRYVLEELVIALEQLDREYTVVHADNADHRGIDVAFIYDQEMFEVDTYLDANTGQDVDGIFQHIVQKRSPTRDIVQVNFKTKQGNEFIVIGNHWPSRSSGKVDSEPYRMMAGETLAYYMERIKDIRGEIPIFVMGDFNDEPFNRSMTKYALSTNSLSKVKSKRSQKPYLFNMMWHLMDGSKGSYTYSDEWSMLDQILVNRAALNSEKLFTKQGETETFSIPDMVRRNKVIRHARPSNKYYNPEGFSDHLPLVLTIFERH